MISPVEFKGIGGEIMAKKIKKMSIEEINAELKKTYGLSVIEIEGFLDEPAYLRPDYESDNVGRTMWEKSE